MNIMQKYVYYMMQRWLQISTGVKKFWMKNMDAEWNEAWKILDKNDEK